MRLTPAVSAAGSGLGGDIGWAALMATATAAASVDYLRTATLAPAAAPAGVDHDGMRCDPRASGGGSRCPWRWR